MSSKQLSGITIEIGGDVTDLSKSLRSLDKDAKKSSDELREIDKLLKLDPKNTELMTQKQKALADSIETTKKRMETLQEAQKQAKEQLEKGDLGEEQYRALQRELIKTGQKLEGLEGQYRDLEAPAREAGEAVEKQGKKAKTARQPNEDLKASLEDLKSAYDDAKSAAADQAKGLGAAGTAIAGAAGATLTMAASAEEAMDRVRMQTGATEGQMRGLEETVNSIFSSGLGEDFDDVAASVGLIAQTTGELRPDRLEALARNAFTLKDAFGFEMEEQLRAVNSLTSNFGITAEQAFGLIAQGAQEGLNRNGDLMDVINEYSVHYKNLGYNADEFMNSLKNGADSGVFSIDKLGDAMKEFGIRTKDGSEGTMSAFAELGLDGEKLTKMFSQGGAAAKQAADEVTGRLNSMRNETAKNRVGVALYGSMWEDMGPKSIAAISDVRGDIKKTKDTMTELRDTRLDSAKNEWTVLGRTVQQQLLRPMGQELLPLAKKIVDYAVKNLPKVLPHLKKIGKMVASILVTRKVVTMVGALAKMISAYKALKVATTAANAAMASTPWGAIGAALGVVVGGVMSLVDAENEAKRAEEEATRALKEQAEEKEQYYEDLAQAAKDSAQERRDAAAGLDKEYDRYEDLWGELQKLVDVNGNVIEGNEDRVEYIRGELSAATGEEIALVDGQIVKYNELRDSIADVLRMKKAQALAGAYEGAYMEAVQNLPGLQGAYEQANAAAKQYPETKKKYEAEMEELEGLRNEVETKTREDFGDVDQYDNWLRMTNRRIAALKASTTTDHAFLILNQNADTNAANARYAYDSAKAVIDNYEALTGAIASGEPAQAETAMNNVRANLITEKSGAALGTLVTQVEDLYNAQQEQLTQSKMEGSSITPQQKKESADLTYRAIYEAMKAAAADKNADPALVNQLIGYLDKVETREGRDSDWARGVYGKIKAGQYGSVDAFMEALWPAHVRAGGRGGAGGRNALYAPGSTSLGPGVLRGFPQAPVPAADDARAIEENTRTQKSAEGILRDIRTLVAGLDLQVVLDDGTVVGHISDKIDHSLGHSARDHERGSFKN